MTLSTEVLTCRKCGHPAEQHSGSFGCIARDADGDCVCTAFLLVCGPCRAGDHAHGNGVSMGEPVSHNDACDCRVAS